MLHNCCHQERFQMFITTPIGATSTNFVVKRNLQNFCSNCGSLRKFFWRHDMKNTQPHLNHHAIWFPIPKKIFIKYCRIEIIAFPFVLFHRDRFSNVCCLFRQQFSAAYLLKLFLLPRRVDNDDCFYYFQQ